MDLLPTMAKPMNEDAFARATSYQSNPFSSITFCSDVYGLSIWEPKPQPKRMIDTYWLFLV